MVVRGALVLRTSARPACLLLPLTSLSSTASAPVVLGFVLLRLSHLCFRPEANFHARKSLHRRSRDFTFVHPTVERLRTNSENLDDLCGRVRLHEKNRIPYSICQVKSGPEGALFVPSGARNSIALVVGLCNVLEQMTIAARLAVVHDANYFSNWRNPGGEG